MSYQVPEPDDWLSQVCPHTEMGRRVAAFDWAATSLGAPPSWPIGLRTAVATCLTTRFPMLVVWGNDLVMIYNDGYRPMLGSEKHPQALGSTAKAVWPEIWDVIGPMLAGVLGTGIPTWVEHQQLLLERNGFPEECYFTYSYSPLFDDQGTISGVLAIAAETTDEVIARRRIACVTSLNAALVTAEQVTDVMAAAAATLREVTADIRAVDLYLRIADTLVLVASNRRNEVSPVDPALLLRVAAQGSPIVVRDTSGSGIASEQFVAPIGSTDAGVEGVFVAALNPLRPFDGAYLGFLEVVAGTIGATLHRAYRRSMELGQYRLISDTLQAAMLPPACDLATVAARYLPATGNLAVGGDWYDIIDLGANCQALIVGDCVGHGLEAATVMAQLRSAARAMMLEGRDPAATLDGLDLFAATVDGAFCTSVVCATIDTEENVLTYASAGHPPPLILTDQGASWLDRAAGVPLGVNGRLARCNATRRLGADDTIILYSDGLIERRAESLDVGFERLLAVATSCSAENAQVLADKLIRDLQPDTSDDVVLVVAHLASAKYPSDRTTTTSRRQAVTIVTPTAYHA